MSVWVAPATWANAALTAAQMNAVRDNLTFLKGALDLITNSTTADTGTATYLNIVRPAAANPLLGASVSGDAAVRFSIAADGGHFWGDGTSAQDVTLYRSAANVLKTDDSLYVANTQGLRVIAAAAQAAFRVFNVDGDANPSFYINSDGLHTWGAGGATATDVDLFRSAANVLKTDDQLWCVDGITTRTVAGAVSDGSFTVTPQNGTIAIDTTNLYIYVRIAGAWKRTAALV